MFFAVECCANAADRASPSVLAAETSLAILCLISGLRISSEQSDAIAHRTAEM